MPLAGATRRTGTKSRVNRGHGHEHTQKQGHARSRAHTGCISQDSQRSRTGTLARVSCHGQLRPRRGGRIFSPFSGPKKGRKSVTPKVGAHTFAAFFASGKWTQNAAAFRALWRSAPAHTFRVAFDTQTSPLLRGLLAPHENMGHGTQRQRNAERRIGRQTAV